VARKRLLSKMPCISQWRSVPRCGSQPRCGPDGLFQAALMTISVAGFGHQIHWEDEEVPLGHRLSFKQAVEIVGTGVFLRVLCPKWIFEWAPTEKIRKVRDGFAEFRVCSLRTRPCAVVLRLRMGLARVVVFGGDDQRTEVIRREGREDGPPLELDQCER
jgi:hypothetical protein